MVNLYLSLTLMIIALLFSAFFSSSEMAYTAVSHVRLTTLVEQGNRRAKQALSIAKNYDQYSSALLFGNGIVNVFNSSMTALISIQYLAPILPNPAIAATLAASLIFFMIVIFGELIPKMVGKVNALSLSLMFVYPVKILRIIFTPFVFMVSLIVFQFEVVHRLFGDQRLFAKVCFRLAWFVFLSFVLLAQVASVGIICKELLS